MKRVIVLILVTVITLFAIPARLSADTSQITMSSLRTSGGGDIKIPEPKPTADTVFINGQVVTMEKDMPRAEALAVQGKNILDVGSNKRLRS